MQLKKPSSNKKLQQHQQQRLTNIGLKNTTNNCFLNAALQCLFHVEAFKQMIEKASRLHNRVKDREQGNRNPNERRPTASGLATVHYVH